MVTGGIWLSSVAGDALFWKWGMKMTDYKIETNIPIPPRKYPFHLMKVGDSFCSEEINVRYAAFTYGKRLGIKFSVRKVQGEKGLRVWRIE